jgi:hypothetical protein
MMIELESFLGADLVLMTFLYGSAAMLISSMIAVTWLCRTTHSPAGDPAVLKLAPRRH